MSIRKYVIIGKNISIWEVSANMLKDHIEKYYIEGNYNCAETIIRAGNDYYELGLHDRDMIAFGVFGAGIQTGNTCGAVLAAASILSMKYVERKAHESDDIKPVTLKLILAAAGWGMRMQK